MFAVSSYGAILQPRNCLHRLLASATNFRSLLLRLDIQLEEKPAWKNGYNLIWIGSQKQGGFYRRVVVKQIRRTDPDTPQDPDSEYSALQKQNIPSDFLKMGRHRAIVSQFHSAVDDGPEPAPHLDAFLTDAVLSAEWAGELTESLFQEVEKLHLHSLAHNDLHSGNILVAIRGGHPVARLVDFGRAEALNPNLEAGDVDLLRQAIESVYSKHDISPEMRMVLKVPNHFASVRDLRQALEESKNISTFPQVFSSRIATSLQKGKSRSFDIALDIFGPAIDSSIREAVFSHLSVEVVAGLKKEYQEYKNYAQPLF